MKREDLERYNIIQLAVFCGQISDNPKMDEKTAEEAWKLKREWMMLVGRQPAPSFKEHSDIQADLDKLKGRMAEFLAVWM